ncbi:hypothetical protein AAFF_G00244040 [Aldrovandia affinis]|uniref:Uncharacterized protein n=1 Tax=Aldrovandia affinis TaxID=143900 RepID=A0AAD7RE05_9TELE|nr:hypothetical protein AAFF_G00244040 [Aldrovandia affinis]
MQTAVGMRAVVQERFSEATDSRNQDREKSQRGPGNSLQKGCSGTSYFTQRARRPPRPTPRRSAGLLVEESASPRSQQHCGSDTAPEGICLHFGVLRYGGDTKADTRPWQAQLARHEL